MTNENSSGEPIKKEPENAVPPQHLATEYLANERTFLAWIRTSIAVISLGFVISKFGLWLTELVYFDCRKSFSLRCQTSSNG